MAPATARLAACLLATTLLTTIVCGQELLAPGDSGAGDKASAALPVAARVDGEAVYDYEVEQALRRTFGNREMNASQRAAWYRKTLDQLVDQRLVVQFARQRGLATSLQFRQSWKQMLETLAGRELTLGDYLAAANRSEAELRHRIWYELAWRALLDHYQTDANLQRHFERHRSQFDGTRLRVAQILWRLPADNSPEAVAALMAKANEVRGQIQRGELSFAQAAERYSQAPSAGQGGDIGWIERHRPMPEEFSRVAFSLEKDQISEPVVTPLGVHLSQLLQVQAGSRTWTEARPELEQTVQRYLFRWVADQQRPHSDIEIHVDNP